MRKTDFGITELFRKITLISHITVCDEVFDDLFNAFIINVFCHLIIFSKKFAHVDKVICLYLVKQRSKDHVKVKQKNETG